MKFAAVAAVSFAALVSAQSRSEIPSCALPCLDASVKKNTKCDTSDFKCICQNFSVIQGDATSCVLQACGQDVAINQVLPATQKLCEEVKNGGGQSSSAPASAPVSSAPASSAPASSAPASSAPASSAPASSAPASSAPATQTGKPTVSTTYQSTLIPTASRSANGTAPTTSAVVAAGAAGFAPVGGLAMLALGVLAL
ncbi:hypothetical protein TOPH_05958 [Tolypocladium ophioglossoides CBS 100239]|uniref:CFEM domain-containing protein n=1 Tax=Tolypocladium ophioglossoides (strain CBS 100239) TaxID=1163406 RepID=A0A0L0N605_TOLOC|nr:hypothetical protein TOPH_05958 [Tolypocladium ophioglossoides CBS 100239]